MGQENAVDEFLNDGITDKKDEFSSDPTDPFNDKEVVEKEEEEVKDEKPLPFHKDPKVQRYVEKQIEKALKTRPTETERFVKETEDDEGDALLNRIIGNDTPEKVQAVKDFKKYLNSLEEKGAERALARLAEQSEEELREEAQATEELEEGFDNIESSFSVDLSSNTPTARKLRADFVEFIKKVAPKDENGDITEFPDLEATFELFQERKKSPTASRAKTLASRSMSRSSDASTETKQGGNSWKDVDKAFAKMS